MRFPQRSFQQLRAAPDFGFTGEESQDIPFVPMVRLPDGMGHKRNAVLHIGLLRRPDNLHREHPPFTLHHRRPQGRCQQPGVHGGRHQQDAEVFPEKRLALPGEGEGLVAGEAPLMEFIENNGRNALQGGIIYQHPGKDSLGDHFYPGVRGDLALEADAVADGLPHGFFQQPGHPLRHLPGGHPPGLQHQNLPRERIQKHERYQRGLARPRGSRHNHGAVPLQGRFQRRCNLPGRQGGTLFLETLHAAKIRPFFKKRVKLFR